MRLCFLAAFFCLVSGCALHYSPTPKIEHWQGDTLTKLKKELGEPELTKQNRNSTVLYGYTTKQRRNFTAPTMTNYSTLVVPGQVAIATPPTIHNDDAYMMLQCTTWFTVNTNQIIVAVNQEGAGC